MTPFANAGEPVRKSRPFVEIVQPVDDRREGTQTLEQVFDVVAFHSRILEDAVHARGFPCFGELFAHGLLAETLIFMEVFQRVSQFVARGVLTDEFVQPGAFPAAGGREAVGVEDIRIPVQFQSVFEFLLRRTEDIQRQFPVFLNRSHKKPFENQIADNMIIYRFRSRIQTGNHFPFQPLIRMPLARSDFAQNASALTEEKPSL